MWPELNAEFFTKILRLYEKDNSIVVSNVNIKPACDVGNNFISIVKKVAVQGYRVLVGGNHKDYHTNLIVKQPLTNEKALDTLPILKLFKNEMIAYQLVVPELNKYTFNGNLPFPKCIHADETTIVLEDLSVHGYENVDKRTRLSLEQIEEVLKDLAKLHAASLVYSVKNRNKSQHLVQDIQEMVFNNASDSLASTQVTNFDIAIRLFKEFESSEENTKIIDTLSQIKSTVLETQFNLITGDRRNRVINHGDTWSNNILVAPQGVKLIDLQMMRYTSVASDLCYFCYINILPKIRRENLNRLLAIYLKHLNMNTQMVGVDLELSLTMEWLKKEMDDFAIIGFMSALWLLPVFYFKKEDLIMEELDPADFLNLDCQWQKCTPEYKEMLEELVRDYINNIKTN